MIFSPNFTTLQKKYSFLRAKNNLWSNKTQKVKLWICDLFVSTLKHAEQKKKIAIFYTKISKLFTLQYAMHNDSQHNDDTLHNDSQV